jgi:hypothetical protein
MKRKRDVIAIANVPTDVLETLPQSAECLSVIASLMGVLTVDQEAINWSNLRLLSPIERAYNRTVETNWI